MKKNVETRIFTAYDGKYSTITVYAVVAGYTVDPMYADYPSQCVDMETTLIGSKKLWGNYSQQQAEKEWKMNRRTFKFQQSEEAKFMLALI